LFNTLCGWQVVYSLTKALSIFYSSLQLEAGRLAISALNLVAALSKAVIENQLDKKLTHFAKQRLLIVGELGYLLSSRMRLAYSSNSFPCATSAALCCSP